MVNSKEINLKIVLKYFSFYNLDKYALPLSTHTFFVSSLRCLKSTVVEVEFLTKVSPLCIEVKLVSPLQSTTVICVVFELEEEELVPLELLSISKPASPPPYFT